MTRIINAKVLRLIAVVATLFAVIIVFYGCENTENESSARDDIVFESTSQTSPTNTKGIEEKQPPSWVDVNLIELDGISRKGEKLTGVNDIVIHYVANPKSTALQNRNYFNNKESGVCSHLIVGLDGEVIQCVPLDEKSAASNDRNHDTISIETCHPDETGKFSDVTYDSLVRITAWLIDAYDLTTDNIIRHHDVTGKNCPKYFVENASEWEKFKEDVANYKK